MAAIIRALRHSVTLLFLINFTLVLVHAKPGTSVTMSPRSDDVDCAVDDDGQHEILDRCLQKGEKFIKKYAKELLGQQDKAFEFCHSSRKYMDCIDDLLQKCPGMTHVMHSHWRNVTDQIRCTCQDKKSECPADLKCLSEEFGSPLVARCNNLFMFNVEQNTQDDCHFLRESINCKDALITSRCGEATGVFAYHVFRLLNDDFVEKHRCHLPRNPTYRGFRYTDNNGQCRNFVSKMKTCVADNINRKQMLHFREDNELVVKEGTSKKKIKDACVRYKNYESCMKPVHTSCPAGPVLVYEIDSELRHYAMKMNFICSKARKRYLPHLRCYHRVHTDGTLQQCNEHVWDDVAAFLDNVTSYEFHCRPELPMVQGLKQELGKVRLCYEEVVTNRCNKTASETLSDFMELVFQDPTYLKQEFRADCGLHHVTKSQTDVPITKHSTARMRTHREHTSRVTKTATTLKHSGKNEKVTVSPWKPTPNVAGQSGSAQSRSIRYRSSVVVHIVTFLCLHYVMIT